MGMATSVRSHSFSVEQLLDAVDHLSPAQKREFERRLAERQAVNGGPGPDEDALVRAARARLPAAEERRLKRLAAKSERGRLTPRELADYRGLAQEAQRIDAARAEAIAELARRRGQSVRAVMAAIGANGGTDGR
jgi:hypothetical protein